jgi:hypothetical protein
MPIKVGNVKSRSKAVAHIKYVTRFKEKLYGYNLPDIEVSDPELSRKLYANLIPFEGPQNGKKLIKLILTLPPKNKKSVSEYDYLEYTQSFLKKHLPRARGYMVVSDHDGQAHRHIHLELNPVGIDGKRLDIKPNDLRDFTKFEKIYISSREFDPPLERGSQTLNYRNLKRKSDENNQATLKDIEAELFQDVRNERVYDDFVAIENKIKKAKRFGRHMKGYDKLVEKIDSHIQRFRELSKPKDAKGVNDEYFLIETDNGFELFDQAGETHGVYSSYEVACDETGLNDLKLMNPDIVESKDVSDDFFGR